MKKYLCKLSTRQLQIRRFSYWDELARKERKKELMTDKARNFNFISGKEVARLPEMPRQVRMTSREFIHNSLYHPQYGYFSKEVKVFSDAPIDFTKIKDNNAFFLHLGKLYENYGNDQIWHTPSEIFKPWYGYAIAKYLINEFVKSNEAELLIYEAGAGNGTLMNDIMTYIQSNHPDIYQSTKYTIIEISGKLANIQKQYSHPVSVLNKSVLEFEELQPKACFFIAMEVLDNLSHDVIRYDGDVPVQGIVEIDEYRDYKEGYIPVSDPLLLEYLKVRNLTNYKVPVLNWRNKAVDLFNPFKANLSRREFVPTNAFQLLKNLKEYFPKHRLIISDFDSLPSTIDGVDAPVVQIRHRDEMVACSDYLVQPGYFDIFFPTNFQLMSQIYQNLTGNSGIVMKHSEFLKSYGNLTETRTRSGDNPMLEYYENVSFLLS
ncbi:hypothetical protein HDV06_003137 [Boothiomyces sp. JEL0866]|nr:hypothetical protein HDV06_003120 [Boothiomyces sp. JEL0866]KAJ3322417.1 hypothetical protein HDV06_003137 [Boothiomyces sp. JEL0866]